MRFSAAVLSAALTAIAAVIATAVLLVGLLTAGTTPVSASAPAVTTLASRAYDAPANIVQRSSYQCPGAVATAAGGAVLASISGRIAAAVFAAEETDTADLPGYSSFRAAKADLGSAGPGSVYDHVVEQSQIARSGFAPEEIHNPFNMDPVPSDVNQLKANYYSSKQFFTIGGTVRDWLTGQSFADQYEFGMDVLMRIQNGMPLP